MFLKENDGQRMVEILVLSDLFDPFMKKVVGRYHAGEEMPEPDTFAKSGLCFPSGEALPRCWIDPHYRD